MRRRIDPRLWWLLGGAAAVSLAWLGVTVGLIAVTLEPEARTRMLDLLGDRWGFVLLMWLVGMGAIAWGLQRAFDVGVHPWRRLAEEAQVLLTAEGAPSLRERGPAEVRRVARLFNQLVQQREAWCAQVNERVREAARSIEQEKTRLAALMAELTQSVVVCNLDGRILLYNNRARLQFRALSQAPTLAGGSELIGLGRSIYTVLDRALIAHALERIGQRLRRGAAHPSAQFVTATRSGQLLRVQVAPVRQVEGGQGGEGACAELAGFVLVLDNITRDHEQAAQRERLWLELTEGARRALANVQAALEVLELPDAEPALRERLLGVVRAEVQGLGERVQRAVAEGAQDWGSQWPMEDMLGADLLAAIERRLADSAGLRVTLAAVDAEVWLRIESFALIQAVVYLARRLHSECGIDAITLRLQPAPPAAQRGGAHVHLDVAWPAPAGEASIAGLMGWEVDPMHMGDGGIAASVRDVVERHGGALWVEANPAAGEACFRLLLPAIEPAEPAEMAATLVRTESRPEYYDFDLFRSSPATQALDDVPLTDLVYTVFDTETTGLNPSEGDEIIQIGATRIVNGKLLRHESFEQLVNPRRPIPRESIPIHGITPEMVADQPDITEVLPAFHAFARDTVLVAHNAAFDMRFLQLKERATGLKFDHPVLDTLLLSAVVHPAQPSHRLEEIAARFGIAVIGRHTALGDAFVTAEVLLRLIPLLQAQGIRTLGEARRAAERTYYARLTY
ncbi:DNA polymerase III PolC-type [Tepidimonas thermarum]|uniref:DNA-directed DNA polymerase n=1 Tax=Tepidimonas thermarum TaxID=335431 RepID=A0A554X7I1_9BURK|nr:exonuclease domain-containing protein [Tepidimonas thermarum]TSE31777.1 DNA polymerase III PolC-type [Tepidimonas thermarum]